jgi:putative membrane protein
MSELYQRDSSIDVLRFVGLSLIILAHSAPPDTIFNLRTFDVPLMLFVSGLTLFNKQPVFSIGVFMHRVLRLVLPVYIFMTIYFIIAVTIQSKGINLNVTKTDIIGTYLLLAGYVWIIRVFLIVGLLTPFLLYLRDHCSAIVIYGIAIIATVVLEVMIKNGVLINNIVVNKYVYYGIGYSVPFLIALKFPQLTLRMQIGTIVMFVILLIACAVFYIKPLGIGNLIIFDRFKYPPQAYYLLYGIVGSLILYMIIVRMKLYKYMEIFSFIGCNTIWIFLYHTPIIQVLTKFTNMEWYVKYIITYSLATILCVIQIKIVNLIQNRSCSNKLSYILKYLKG